MPAHDPNDVPDLTDFWDDRSAHSGLLSVFTKRWSDEQRRAVDEAQSATMIRLAGPLEDQTVLDLGCGVGRLSARLAPLAGSVTGIDISRGMIDRARERVPGAEFRVTRPGQFDLPDAHFDCIIASFVFQHILDDEVFTRTLGECDRVLRPGGRLVMMEGLGAQRHRPDNSDITVVRTLADIAGGLGDRFALEEQRDCVWVEDRYQALRWRKR